MVDVQRGMRVVIPAGGLVISLDGPSYAKVELALETWPHWLAVAVGMAERADAAHHRLHVAGTADEQRSADVDAEFECAMTAVAGSAFALDAFYASVVDRSPTPDVVGQQWSAKRTGRANRIAQTLRRCFTFTNDQSREVGTILRQVFHLRDSAVHPPAGASSPVSHPVTGRETHRAFAAYTADNAVRATGAALRVIAHCGRNPRSGLDADFLEWCEGFVTSEVQALIDNFKASGLDR